MKLEIKQISEQPRKLKVKWTIEQGTDAAAVYAPNIPESFLRWSDWKRTFVIFPRKTIYNKWCWGFVNKRKREIIIKRVRTERQYATKKELFRWKLNGG